MMMPYSRSAPRPARGFTLIELMIVVAIIAILAAIALPSYQNSVRKGRRVEAKSALLDLAAREEKYFAINNNYAIQGTKLGYASDSAIDVNSSGKVYYKIDITQPAAGGYTATATAQGDQVNDPCPTFSVNHLGVQTATTPDCW